MRKDAANARSPKNSVPRCLVVEDDPNEAELSSMALTAMGANVTVADTAERVFELLKQSDSPDEPNFDIIFLDLRLHGIWSGVDVLSYVREHYPSIHVIIVSGYLADARFIEALSTKKAATGYLGVISKPLEKLDVSEILSKHRLKD